MADNNVITTSFNSEENMRNISRFILAFISYSIVLTKGECMTYVFRLFLIAGIFMTFLPLSSFSSTDNNNPLADSNIATMGLSATMITNDIEGYVIDSVNGENVPEATVRLYKGGIFIRETISDASGWYRIDAYPSSGVWYILEASKQNYGTTVDSVYHGGQPILFKNLYLCGEPVGPTGSLTGIVIDSVSGSPIANAIVRLSTQPIIEQIITTVSGVFEFTGVESGQVGVWVYAAGHDCEWVYIDVTANGPNNVTIEMGNQASSGDIEGTVYDEDGTTPMVGVTVNGVEMGGCVETPNYSIVTSSDGNFFFPSIETWCNYTVSVSKDGYVQDSMIVNAITGQTTTISFTMQLITVDSGIVRGTVTDSVTGLPLEDIIIHDGGGGLIYDRTDSNGEYSFGWKVGIFPTFAAHHYYEEYYDQSLPGGMVVEGQELVRDILMQPIVSTTGSICGEVRYWHDLWPANGVAMTLLDTVMPIASTNADTEGKYCFEGLEAGEYAIEAFMPGYITEYNIKTIPFDTAVQLDITLYKGILNISPDTIVFRATAGGNNPDPLSFRIYNYENSFGYSVKGYDNWLSVNPDTASASGTPPEISVDITGLSARIYYDTLIIVSMAAKKSPQELLVILDIETTATDPGAFSGTVKSKISNVPINGATITVKMGAVDIATTTTAQNGSYTISDLEPGDYTLYASHADFWPETKEATITVGTTTNVNFSLISQLAGVIVGHLCDENTKLPLVGATVRAWRVSHIEDSTTTDSLGAYQFSGLEVGAGWWVQASAYGYATWPELAENDEYLVLDYYTVDTVDFCLRNYRTWHVDTLGNNETGDGSFELPFATIQHGIDIATHGDIVLVHEGVYEGGVIFHGKGILLTSEYLIDGSSSHIDNTVICGGSHADTLEAVSFVHGEDSTSIIQGFTIMQDSITIPMSGKTYGIVCYLSSPIIRNNRITFNRRGIHCKYSANPLILDNIIEFNAGENRGAGIYCQDSSEPEIRGNTIRKNSSTYDGGGLACFQSSHAYVVDNVFDSNMAVSEGGAMWLTWFSEGLVDSNIVTGNSAKRGGGIFCDREADFLITNNQIIGNSALGETAQGGGICISGVSEPHVIHNQIERNYSEWRGGGIACYGTNWPTIDTNRVTSNTAYEGGGMYIGNLVWTHVRDNIIDSNLALSSGGGVYCWATEAIFMRNLFAYNNSDTLGGAVAVLETHSLYENPVTFTNCTFVGNKASEGSAFGLLFDGHPHVELSIITSSVGSPVVNCRANASITFDCTDIFGNAEGDWADCYADQLSLRNNFSADPLLCNPASGNYMIGSLSRCSSEHPENNCGELIGAYGIGCFPAADVPIGSEVEVQISNQVTLKFDSVDVAGVVELELTPTGPPAGFQIVPSDFPVYYNITTTATFDGMVDICIEYDDDRLTITEEKEVTLWHCDEGGWHNIKTTLDTDLNIVCGQTNSFSPFVIGLDPGLSSSDHDEFSIPHKFSVSQNYPNPFNPVTKINFALPRLLHTKLEVFNIAGQRVTTLVDKQLNAGYHTVTWDASNNATGIYFYRIHAGEYVKTKKMILLK